MVAIWTFGVARGIQRRGIAGTERSAWNSDAQDDSERSCKVTNKALYTWIKREVNAFKTPPVLLSAASIALQRSFSAVYLTV